MRLISSSHQVQNTQAKVSSSSELFCSMHTGGPGQLPSTFPLSEFLAGEEHRPKNSRWVKFSKSENFPPTYILINIKACIRGCWSRLVVTNQHPRPSFEAGFLELVLCLYVAWADSIWMQSHSKRPYLASLWTGPIVSAYESNKDSQTPPIHVNHPFICLKAKIWEWWKK